MTKLQTRRRIMTKTKPICIRLPEKWISALKSKSRKISYEKGKDINFHDLIREAIFENNKELTNEKI